MTHAVAPPSPSSAPRPAPAASAATTGLSGLRRGHLCLFSAPKAAGRIVERPVAAGRQVAEGDVLFTPRRRRPEGGRRRRRSPPRPGQGATRQPQTGKRDEEIGVIAAQLSEARATFDHAEDDYSPQARASRKGRRRPVGRRRRQGQARHRGGQRRVDRAPARRGQAAGATGGNPGGRTQRRGARRRRSRRPRSRSSGGRSTAPAAALVEETFYEPGELRQRRPAGGFAAAARPTARCASSCPRASSPRSNIGETGRGRAATGAPTGLTARDRLHRHPGRVHAAGPLFEGQPREAGLPGRSAAGGDAAGAQGRPAGRRPPRPATGAGHERRADHRHRGADQALRRQDGRRPCRPDGQSRRDRRLPRAERLRQDDDDPHDLRAARARRRQRHLPRLRHPDPVRPDQAGGRLHDPAVLVLRGPDDPRESRLRRPALQPEAARQNMSPTRSSGSG